MPTMDVLAELGIVVGGFGVAILTAILPWLNAEILLLSALPTAAHAGLTAPLVGAVAAGQMVGKSAMYWSSRRAIAIGRGPTGGRRAATIERWRAWFERHPRAVLLVVLLSGIVGLPPFYAVSLAAGAIAFPFRWFLLVGGAGRLVHFGLVAWLGR